MATVKFECNSDVSVAVLGGYTVIRKNSDTAARADTINTEDGAVVTSTTGNQLIMFHPQVSGEKYTVSAIADTGFTFDHWSVGANYSFTSDTTVYAVFKAKMNTITFKVSEPGFSVLPCGSIDTSQLLLQSGITYKQVGNELRFSDGVRELSSKVTATVNTGFSVHWYSGTITANGTIYAWFDADRVGLSVTRSPYNAGTIVYESGSAGITSYDADYGSQYTTDGNKVTLYPGTSSARIWRADPNEGYRFVSWSPESGIIKERTIVTANFAKKGYTVTISVYGSGTVSASSVEDVASGTAISSSGSTLTVGSTEITATPASGYTFSHWAIGSSTVTSDMTVSAHFTESKRWYYARLYYDANGGSGAPSTQSDSIYASSASGSKTFTISSTKPTRSGYDFLGWSTSSTATSASYSAGSTISVSYGSSKRLYAVWATQTFTVTIVAGSGGSVSPSSISGVPYGSTISASGNTLTINGTTVTAAAGNHYHFASWSKSSGTITSNTTITANFAIDTFTVTISAGAHGSVSSTTLDVGDGSTWTSSGNTLTFADGQKVTATPDSGYLMVWSPAEGTVVSATTITVTFVVDYVPPPFRVRTGDGWRYAAVSVKVDGAYRSAEAYVKVDGAWVKKESRSGSGLAVPR